MLPSPAADGSGEPYLFTSEDNEVLLTWISESKDTDNQLLLSKLNGDKWSNPTSILSGRDWFVNWADFPTIVSNGNLLLSHVPTKSGSGTYAYDVSVIMSKDDGITWDAPFILHDDSTQTEHGFVTALPYKDGFFLTWLDGRNTGGGHGHGDDQSAMSIRGAIINGNGEKTDDFPLDMRVCDCCQTGAAITDNGPIVVYRDRSNFEIRDTYIVRMVEGKWTEPMVVFKDGWEISGCPVNGPKAAAVGNNLAVAWFTAAKGVAAVNLAFSTDGGATFNDPIRIDEGNPLGRIDLVMRDDNSAYISWMESAGDNAVIKFRQANLNGSIEASATIASSSAARASGFPQMTKATDKLYFAWTDADSTKMVKTAVFRL